MTKTVETCCMADQYCDAPGNLEPPVAARCTCFSCGGKVCKKCSMVIAYRSYGFRRLCNDCIEEVDGNDDRLIAKLERLGGYKVAKKKKKATRKAKKKKITIIANPEENLEILAESIIQVAGAFQEFNDSRLTKRAIILLIQDRIGSTRINRSQIEAVLGAAAELKSAYIKKSKKDQWVL